MNSQQIQSLINKTHIAVINTVTGGHWNYSQSLQDKYDSTNFRELDFDKTPEINPALWTIVDDTHLFSDFEIEVQSRADDFIETIINVLHGDDGCFTNINTKAMDTDRNIFWCFDDDNCLLIFLAKDENDALDKFNERVESWPHLNS